MNPIDAIEGTVKSILDQWHAVFIEQHLDDSEYVRNVKAVLDATAQYLSNNPEIVDNPKLLLDVLYIHSRNLWLMGAEAAAQEATTKIKPISQETEEYQTYYYDYLFHQGIYPR